MPYSHSRKGSRFIANSDSEELHCTATSDGEESSEESFEEENRQELRRALSQAPLADVLECDSQVLASNMYNVSNMSNRTTTESIPRLTDEHDLTEEDLSIVPSAPGPRHPTQPS